MRNFIMMNVAKKLARMKDGTVIDLSTNNVSFKQVARDLQQLGVHNYYFLLQLHDPSLTKINPHAVDKQGHTTLSKDEVTRVLNECAINVWYFLREVARVKDQGGTVVSYKANRGNIAQAWCMRNGIDSWLCLPRQQGKTISALVFLVWAFLFGTTNSTFIFVNKDGDQCKENLKRFLDLLHELPEYMQCRSIVTEDGKRDKARENATITTNPVNNNQIIVKAKAQSKDNAMSLARGLTAPIIYFDEPEFTNYIDIIVNNSVATYKTAAEHARENKALFGRIFTCTPTVKNKIKYNYKYAA